MKMKNKNNTQQPGLKLICQELFEGKQLCKEESKSNWDIRPLRESQQHYAALDAYILVEIYKKLREQLKEDKKDIASFIQKQLSAPVPKEKKIEEKKERGERRNHNIERNAERGGRKGEYN